MTDKSHQEIRNNLLNKIKDYLDEDYSRDYIGPVLKCDPRGQIHALYKVNITHAEQYITDVFEDFKNKIEGEDKRILVCWRKLPEFSDNFTTFIFRMTMTSIKEIENDRQSRDSGSAG